MSSHQTHNKKDLAKIVEKQMRNWELSRAQRSAPTAEGEPAVAEFVSISRSVGSGGSEVASLLGERTGWPVFDREIFQAMAGDDGVRAKLYENMDERDETWRDNFARWLLGGELRKEDYFYRLTETILTLARQGHAIFLGRAADMILPRDQGLRVRIVAPMDKRVAEMARRNGVSEALARAEVERIDQERAEFRRNHFGKTAGDPTRFDLMINLDRLGAAQGVELVSVAMRSLGMIS